MAENILHWTGRTERITGSVLMDPVISRRWASVMVLSLVGLPVEEMIAALPHLL